jgi:hypothetical protein
VHRLRLVDMGGGCSPFHARGGAPAGHGRLHCGPTGSGPLLLGAVRRWSGVTSIASTMGLSGMSHRGLAANTWLWARVGRGDTTAWCRGSVDDMPVEGYADLSLKDGSTER